MSTTFHTPVMGNEVVQFLVTENPQAKTFLDMTLGGGGHSALLLESTSPDSCVTGIDQDRDALDRATARLEQYGERFVAHHANFSACSSVVPHASVDGAIADLGVSSYQLNMASRGFSFQNDGPLDMRMDRSAATNAAAVVNTAKEEELKLWFQEYGEERFSGRIARAICQHREDSPYETTSELAETVRRAVPPQARRGKIHPATRTFQALRIVVNEELQHLEQLLNVVPQLLRLKGRFAVISYHSLEDRLVKHRFRRLAKEMDDFIVLTKRPLTPTDEECDVNPRARSAKFRVLERRAS